MALFDRFKKVYVIKAHCFNCGHTQDLRVPKGMTIDSYLKTEAAMCENCGNPTLRRILSSQVTAPQEARKPLFSRKEKPMPQLPPLPPLRQRPRPQPRQNIPQRRENPRQPFRPQVQRYPDNFEQEVDYPVNEPVDEEGYVEPEWTAKPKKINFWTGKEEA